MVGKAQGQGLRQLATLSTVWKHRKMALVFSFFPLIAQAGTHCCCA